MTNLLNDNMVYAISQTVLHSFWQALIIGVILFFALKLTSPKKAELRYWMSLSALSMTFIAAIYTFIYFLNPSSEAQVIFSGTWESTASFLSNEAITRESITLFIIDYQWYISNFWLVGVVLLSLRLIFGIGRLRFLSQNSSLIENALLQKVLKRIKVKMDIQQSISIYQSARTSAPITFGFFKSLILLPIGIINLLTIEEVETIIAHELYHIKRYDFVINILQSIVETIFYYHPIVWWFSYNIRLEREHSCDIVAMDYCQGEINYAKLLVKLQEIQLTNLPHLAMPFASRENIFTNRIKKILNMKQSNLNLRDKLLATLLVLTVFAFFSFTNFSDREILSTSPLEKISSVLDSPEKETFPLSLKEMKVDTIPYSNDDKDFDITISSNEELVQIELEDGEITRLVIDGEEKEPAEFKEYTAYLKDLEIEMNSNNFLRNLGDKNKDGFTFHSNNSDDGFEMIFPNLENGIIADFGHSLEWDQDLESFVEDLEGNSEMLRMELDSMKNRLKEIHKLKLKSNGDTDWIKEIHRLKKLPNGDTKWVEEMVDIKKLERFDSEAFKDLHRSSPQWHFFKDKFPDHISKPDFGGTKPANKIERELNRDGLLEVGQYNKVELTLKHLKINGDKQPKNLHSKYLNLYVSLTGFPMTKSTKLEFQLQGKKTSFPRTI